MPSIDDARHAREERAAVLQDLENGERSIRAVLSVIPGPLKNTDLYYVLLATKGMGREGVRQTCERARVWPHTQMKDLSNIQRALLKKHLPRRAQ